MTDKDKQKILAEIERQIEHSKHCYEFTHSNSARKFQDGEISGFKTIQKFINSLPEEPVSEELEEAAKDYARFDDYYDNKEYDGFKAGAKWDRKHILESAINVEVIDSWTDGVVNVNLPIAADKGDNIKVIIVKED